MNVSGGGLRQGGWRRDYPDNKYHRNTCDAKRPPEFKRERTNALNEGRLKRKMKRTRKRL